VTPTTALDVRYSDPTAVAIDWEQTRQILEDAQMFWISTVRADGRPHVTPLVAVWLDGALHFHTGAGEQKFANLRTNPHVVLTTGCSQWDGGVDVILEGPAVPTTDRALLQRLAEAWADKWDGRWQLAVRDGGFRSVDANLSSVVFSVTPTTVYAHAKGDPFAQTTHRF
jgi:general stress protein 26